MAHFGTGGRRQSRGAGEKWTRPWGACQPFLSLTAHLPFYLFRALFLSHGDLGTHLTPPARGGAAWICVRGVYKRQRHTKNAIPPFTSISNCSPLGQRFESEKGCPVNVSLLRRPGPRLAGGRLHKAAFTLINSAASRDLQILRAGFNSLRGSVFWPRGALTLASHTRVGT